jgi:hypothetical protein
MKFLFLLVLLVGPVLAHEKELPTRADKMAFGVFTEQRNHPWPFPLLSIGHAMQSYQDYSNDPYWHDGLDIRSRQDQPIFAAAGGKVVNIENYNTGPLYWEVAILDEEGFVWKYHHVDRDSIPADIFKAYQSKGSIPSGTLIGNVVRWPISSFGEVYHHCHLLVVGADGRYVNPFLMMEPLADTQAPVINRIGIAKNHKPLSGNVVSGEHALFVEASDLVLHQKFILPPHRISYRLDQGEEKVVWEFVNLPSLTNDTDFIKDFFFDGTCGNYSCRKFYFNLNFTREKPRGTMTLAKGTHEVEVTVEDLVGNRSTKSYQYTVQ